VNINNLSIVQIFVQYTVRYYTMQAAEENVAKQQQVLGEVNTRGDELKMSLQTLVSGRPIDSVDTEIAAVHDSWQLIKDVSDV